MYIHPQYINCFHLLWKVHLLHSAREQCNWENKKAAVLLIFSKNVCIPQCIWDFLICHIRGCIFIKLYKETLQNISSGGLNTILSVLKILDIWLKYKLLHYHLEQNMQDECHCSCRSYTDLKYCRRRHGFADLTESPIFFCWKEWGRKKMNGFTMN